MRKENVVLNYDIAMNITKLILREDLDCVNEEINRLVLAQVDHPELETYLDIRQSIKTLLTCWYGEEL